MRYREILSENTRRVRVRGLSKEMKDVTVKIDPSSADIARLVAGQFDYACAALDEHGHVYVWSGRAVVDEHEMSRALHLDDDTTEFFTLMPQDNSDKTDQGDDSSIRITATADGRDRLTASPAFREMMGNKPYTFRIRRSGLSHTMSSMSGARFGTMMRRAENYDKGFAVLDHDRDQHSAERPLVVVIHPGDMIETGVGYPPEVRQAVNMFWHHNSQGTARELSQWRKKGADFVVLHRMSCEQFPEQEARSRNFGGGKLPIWAEIKRGHTRGTMLFGDDLKSAANWMIRNLHIKDRPHIFLAGAYSTPDSGCLTAIGQAFEQVVGPDRISVSEFSPPAASPGPVWRPGGKTKEMEIDDTISPNLRAQLGKARKADDAL